VRSLLSLKSRFNRRGISEVLSNLVITLTLTAIIISTYVICFNHSVQTLDWYGEVNAKEIAVSIVDAIESISFKDEAVTISIPAHEYEIFIEQLGRAHLLINGVPLCEWNIAQISIQLPSYSSPRTLIYGVNEFFAVNTSSISIIREGFFLRILLNIKVVFLNDCLYIKMYSIKEGVIEQDSSIKIRVISVTRLLREVSCENGLLTLSLIGDIFRVLKLSSNFKNVHVLVELFILEVK